MTWPMRSVVRTRQGGRMTHTLLAAKTAGSPILAMIVGCEIGFWVLVLGGLAVRYLLRMPGLSKAILLLVPLLDITLLVAVALDLNRGTQVDNIHCLAGIYLGVTVAFGHSMIAWADARFAHRFADGPTPAKPPERGPAALRRELRLFAQWLVAAGISALAIGLLSHTVADAEQAADLADTYDALGIVTVIWLLTGPVWVLFSAKDDEPSEPGHTRV